MRNGLAKPHGYKIHINTKRTVGTDVLGGPFTDGLIKFHVFGPSRTPVPTVQNSVPSRFVSTFKRFCNKEYGINIWQYRSNDHIIRNRQDYEEHLRYIYENPMRWYYDELYTEE